MLNTLLSFLRWNINQYHGGVNNKTAGANNYPVPSYQNILGLKPTGSQLLSRRLIFPPPVIRVLPVNAQLPRRK